MVFTTRLSGGKGGRNGFEHELRRLGVVQKNSRPNHPTTYTARPKAGPGDRSTDHHARVRADRIDAGGKVTLRHGGRLYSIGIGRPTPEPAS